MEERFAADRNLGKLVKWLLILGYDTLYDRGTADRHFLRRAGEDGRIALTRKRDLARLAHPELLVVVNADPLHACALVPSLSGPEGLRLQMKLRRTKSPPDLTVADMHKTHICGTPVLAIADMHKTHICGTPSWKIIVRVPRACALCMPAHRSRAYRVLGVYLCR